MPGTLESIRARVWRYRWLRSRRAVLGPGVLAEAGHLWRDAMAEAGTSVDVLHALARLHWSRYRASFPRDLLNDFQAGLLLFNRVATAGSEGPGLPGRWAVLVPRDVRQLLSRSVIINHEFVGPEHWGRVGIHLLRQMERSPDAAILDLVIDIFEGTTAAYSPGHPFWEGDVSNLQYARQLRARCR